MDMRGVAVYPWDEEVRNGKESYEFSRNYIGRCGINLLTSRVF